MTDVIKLTQDLIRCASVTPKDEGAQKILADILTEAGFECYHLPFGEGDKKILNLFARIGTTGPHICYGGHTDVVPPGPLDEWTFDPFDPQIKDGIMYGRGTSDMKGSVAAFAMAAVDYIKKHGMPEQGSISLLITGDEEAEAINGTIKVLDWMSENGHTPDVALVGEPTNPDIVGEEMKIGRRGSLTGIVTVKGKQGHVAYPERSDNPLPRLIKMADVLASYEFDQGNDFFQPTNLEMNTIDVDNPIDNLIPGAGSFMFNIRYNDIWTHESLCEKIQQLLDSVTTDYSFETIFGSRSFRTDPGAWPDTVKQAVEDVTGKTPKFSTTGGTSDARFFSQHCPIIEFGPINKTIHQIDENIAVKDLETTKDVFERVIELYFKG